MLPARAVRPFGTSLLAAIALLACLAAPAAAQDPNTGSVTVSGALDFSNAYMFRGIKQETEGLVMWPYLDVGLTLYEGEGSLRTFGVNFGTWNSLHASGPTGTDNPRNHKLWYESDFYTTIGFGLPHGVGLGITYTAYTSPNDAFSSIKEVAFKLGWDDSDTRGGKALRPYTVIAFETDTATRQGQADGGVFWGTYLELGIAPGYELPWGASISVPLKAGFSLSDYYEHPVSGFDDSFGFASLAGIVTVPFTEMPTRLGHWNLHGGVEVLKLNRTTRAFLNDVSDEGRLKSWKTVYTLGLGFTY